MDRIELELEIDNLRLKLESAAEDNAALYRENTVLRGLIDALAEELDFDPVNAIANWASQ